MSIGGALAYYCSFLLHSLVKDHIILRSPEQPCFSRYILQYMPGHDKNVKGRFLSLVNEVAIPDGPALGQE